MVAYSSFQMGGSQMWIWRGVFSSLLAALFWFGGAAVLAFVKRRWPKYGDLILYWLGSAVIIGVLWFEITGHPPLMAFPPRTTTENVGENIKTWAENLGVPIAKQTAPTDVSFAYAVTSKDGLQIMVERLLNDKPNYVQFATGVTAPPEIQTLLSTLTEGQMQTLTDEIGAELDQERIAFSFSTATPTKIPNNPQLNPQLFFSLEEGIPISELNEQKFAQSLDDINFTANFIKLRTKLLIKSLNVAKSTAAASKSVTQN